MVHTALSHISELLATFKLMTVGTLFGRQVRTVGVADALAYTSFVNGKHTGDVNIAHVGRQVGNAQVTTELVRPYVASEHYPIARRYVRCFELIELGLFREAIVVAHAILDDIVQDMIHRLLESKGLDEKTSRAVLIRAIKEDRFNVYLGPLLKVLAGVSIDEIWKDASKAVGFLNIRRNAVAHSGSLGDRDSACKAVFVSMKTVAALNSRQLVDAKFPPGMRRHSRIEAAWTLERPDWAPADEEIETDEFDEPRDDPH